jgi:hypothetical protein
MNTTVTLLGAALAAATMSCGSHPARVSSVVADRPLSYSEDERLDEIERLDGRIASEMSVLGLSRSDSDTKIVSEPDVPDIAHDDGDDEDVDASSDPPTVTAGSTAVEAKSSRSTRSWCDRVCDSARAICDAADKICRIADSLPGHPTARDRCARAREDCTAARGKGATCGCG